MNIATRWMSPPRDNSIRHRNITTTYSGIDVRLTWLHRCSQEERDPSLLNRTVYSSRICTNIGAPLPITFETRSAFARTFR